MRNFQKRGKILSFLQSPPALIVLAAGALLFAYSLIGLAGKMRETSKNTKIAEAQVMELRQSQEKLTADIAKLNTPEGVEESIREKFGLVKEGEGVIVIVEDKREADASAEADSGGFFSFLKNLFK